MINFVLCDDNAQLLSKLQDTLEAIFLRNDLDACVNYSTTNAKDLIDYIHNNKVDVLFLDIDLDSNYNGIELAKEIRKDNKLLYLIFVTGHFEYIISAYECKTFDFIQKPFSQSKIESTILRLFEDLEDNSASFIKLSKTGHLLNQSTINYIQKNGMKTIYNLDSGTIESYGSFISIADTLPNNFVRCHKSFIVNINNISNIDAKNNTIYFRDSSESKCYIGPKYKSNFMEVLKNHGTIK